MEIKEPLVSEWVVALAEVAAELVSDAEKYRVETIKLTNSGLEYELEDQLDSAIIFFKRVGWQGISDERLTAVHDCSEVSTFYGKRLLR